MSYNSRPTRRPSRPRRPYRRRKVCRYCADSSLVIDYKDIGQLRYFTTDRGKMIPRRISGTCATHQRKLSTAIKRARVMALMPYAAMAGGRQ